MTTVGRCMACGRLLERDRVEITTLSEEVPRFIDGPWEMCCGWPVATVAPPLGRLHGPAVPTPEDLLREAGLSVGWP